MVAAGSLALDGSLGEESRRELMAHVGTCRDCATYVDQMSTTAALLAARPGRAPRQSRPASIEAADGAAERDPEAVLAQSQRALIALARAADADHADDLVQETWDHFLGGPSSSPPTRQDLTDHLLGLIGEHQRDEDISAEAWAESLLNHQHHHPADLAESDLPADPASYDDLRALADLDTLDPDADQAELLFPDLYSDGPDKGHWASPPTAWPSVTRVLGPDDEVGTSELYSIVDAALDELPADLGDALYLVDIEGHSLETASGLLDRGRGELQRDLVRARAHVRGRVNDYLSGS
jgi:DNA-directed RNA polymerase specialized sigma24 family protein